MLGSFYKLQVDFGVMQWQQFSRNREPVSLFSPIGSVKKWLDKQDKNRAGSEFGYRDNITDEYVNVNLPVTIEQSLNNGEYLMLNDDYSITPISEQEDMTNN